MAALLSGDGVELLPLGSEWPLLEPLCRQHQLVGNAISDSWIVASVLAHRDCLVTFGRDFVPLVPSRQAQTRRMRDGPDTGPCRVRLG